ncbi:hypothetical protein B0J13DRAFT_536533 [Dactylonectria estremocensis]|uniref:Uncharacterized protein n=1 Tax=Dactylonectria estremocensis TaxID=1079267 RepID=A0A9P9JKY9_9HYPO|nr:hypothetical protein B0J13DRAFT_536533 [Dactylonectria estremocensis]
MSCHVRESPKASSGRLASHAVIGRRDYSAEVRTMTMRRSKGRDDGSSIAGRNSFILPLGLFSPIFCPKSFSTVQEPRPRPKGRPVNHGKRSKRMASRNVVESGHEFDWGMEHSAGHGLMGLMDLIDESVETIFSSFLLFFLFPFCLSLVLPTAI